MCAVSFTAYTVARCQCSSRVLYVGLVSWTAESSRVCVSLYHWRLLLIYTYCRYEWLPKIGSRNALLPDRPSQRYISSLRGVFQVIHTYIIHTSGFPGYRPLTTHIENGLTRKGSRMPASLNRRSGRWLGSGRCLGNGYDSSRTRGKVRGPRQNEQRGTRYQ